MKKSSGMRRIRAIVYGIGAAGNLTPKFMVEKGIDIVGAIDINPSIVGKDVGEVSALGYPINVIVSDNPDAVLSQQEADIAVISTFTEMEKVFPHIQKCIENDMNVITLSEEAFCPWRTSPVLSSKLDKLAKKHGVTVAASGSQDAIMSNMLTLLTSGSHRIISVSGRLENCPDDFGPVVLEKYHCGETVSEFERKIKKHGVVDNLVWETEAVIVDLGLTVKKVERKVVPVLAETDVKSRGLRRIVKKGEVLGIDVTSTIETEQGISFNLRETGKIRPKDAPEAYINEWFIHGEPEDIWLKCKRAPSVVMAAMVHRIPDVINSQPGFVTTDQLPKLKYRAYPIHFYIH